MLQNVVEPRKNANKNAYQRRVIDVIGPASTGRFLWWIRSRFLICQEGCKKLHIVDVWTIDTSPIVDVSQLKETPKEESAMSCIIV